jgi:hypothetical protein
MDGNNALLLLIRAIVCTQFKFNNIHHHDPNLHDYNDIFVLSKNKPSIYW